MKDNPQTFAATKRRLYAAFLNRLEEELEERDVLGLVVVDGDGQDPTYRSVHRELHLRTRRTVEDAVHFDSKNSQLVQIADLVAWTSFTHLNRHDGNKFAHDWYTKYLAPRDPQREPLMVAP